MAFQMRYSVPKFLSDDHDWSTDMCMREGRDSSLLQLHEDNDGMNRALFMFPISDKYENACVPDIK